MLEIIFLTVIVFSQLMSQIYNDYCRTGIFRKRAIFGIWLICVFGKAEFSEFAVVEFLPILIKVDSAERLMRRFSVSAPKFRSCCVYKIVLSLRQRCITV